MLASRIVVHLPVLCLEIKCYVQLVHQKVLAGLDLMEEGLSMTKNAICLLER